MVNLLHGNKRATLSHVSPHVGTSSVHAKTYSEGTDTELHVRIMSLQKPTFLATWTCPLSVARATATPPRVADLVAVMVATGEQLTTLLDERITLVAT